MAVGPLAPQLRQRSDIGSVLLSGASHGHAMVHPRHIASDDLTRRVAYPHVAFHKGMSAQSTMLPPEIADLRELAPGMVVVVYQRAARHLLAE